MADYEAWVVFGKRNESLCSRGIICMACYRDWMQVLVKGGFHVARRLYALLLTNRAQNPTNALLMLFAATKKLILLPVSRQTCIATRKSKNYQSRSASRHQVLSAAHLVVVRRGHKYNRAISWYMVRSSWSNFSKEYVDNCLPEE